MKNNKFLIENTKTMFTFFILVVSILLISETIQANECQDEEEPGNECQVYSPSNITCTTYSILAENGTQIIDGATMSELSPGSTVYNFTFQQTQTQAYYIQFCDGSFGTIKVGDTLRQEVDAVEENQVVIQQLILDTQTNVTDINNSLSVENDVLNGLILDTQNNITDINNSLSAENKVLEQLILDTQINATAPTPINATLIWEENITMMSNQTAGGQVWDTWRRVRDQSSGSLIFDLLAELAGGFFG